MAAVYHVTNDNDQTNTQITVSYDQSSQRKWRHVVQTKTNLKLDGIGCDCGSDDAVWKVESSDVGGDPPSPTRPRCNAHHFSWGFRCTWLQITNVVWVLLGTMCLRTIVPDNVDYTYGFIPRIASSLSGM